MKRCFVPVLFFVAFPVITHAQSASTWATIQESILNRNCVSCHIEGSSFARQSGLVLTANVAYDNLVSAPPQNAAAKADALIRVSKVGGFAGLQQSFLWEKINAAEQNHFYNDHPNYGQIMPLGAPYLTNGELAFIKAWIEAGAPSGGVVANTNLLNDQTRYTPPDFKVLNPPAQGLQFRLGPFDVWPAQVHDREFLYFEPYQTTEDKFITRYEISMRPGSHHLILYHYPNGKVPPPARTYRDLRNSAGNINFNVAFELNSLFPFQFYVGTQVPYMNYYLPKDVALRLPAGYGFDLNSHSVNRSGQTQKGEAYINFYTVDRSQVKYIADYDNLGNNDITLPPNRVTTISKTFTFSETRHLIQMFSHAHERMTEFSVTRVGGARDGELIYWTNDWAHPPTLELDPPLTLNAGDRLKISTTYNNTTNQTIRFGPLSSDEMQFLFYIYYTGTVSRVAENEAIPAIFELSQNYPNPFSPRVRGIFDNPATEIAYALPKNGVVNLTVYDLQGKAVAEVLNQFQVAGEHRVRFDGRHLASGVYFYTLRAGELKLTRKMLLTK